MVRRIAGGAASSQKRGGDWFGCLPKHFLVAHAGVTATTSPCRSQRHSTTEYMPCGLRLRIVKRHRDLPSLPYGCLIFPLLPIQPSYPVVLNSLLLVYPAPGDGAVRCMKEYRGDALVYVGEGRGGANASDAFFDILDTEWDVVEIADLDPFPQCFERLYVLRRRKQAAVASSPQNARSSDGTG